jgi:Uri superfamily endonuclease
MTYLLCIKVDEDLEVTVGRLGLMNFKRGLYIYVGSAKRNLAARIKRHLGRNKKIFWHVDYLLSRKAAEVSQIWLSSSGECRIAKKISKLKGSIPVKGFGCSDCKCLSHLFYCKQD